MLDLYYVGNGYVSGFLAPEKKDTIVDIAMI